MTVVNNNLKKTPDAILENAWREICSIREILKLLAEDGATPIQASIQYLADKLGFALDDLDEAKEAIKALNKPIHLKEAA